MVYDITIFYALKFLIVLFSVLVVTIRNPIQSILLLIALYLSISFVLFFIELEFLAFIFVTLYVGAVTILFLFVVMLIDVQPSDDSLFRPYYLIPVILVLSIFSYELSLSSRSSFSFQNPIFITNMEPFVFSLIDLSNLINSPSHTHLIGIYIFTLGAFPLFLLGFVLLIALIGPITLTLSHDRSNRKQLIHLQNLSDISSLILYSSSDKKKKT